MTDEHPGDHDAEIETTKTRIIAALAEARKARHNPHCHCRRFDNLYCNATDALWSRALERELTKLKPPQ